MFGPLAQLVEQWTFNPFVEGSNPSRPTTFVFNKIFTVNPELFGPLAPLVLEVDFNPLELIRVKGITFD